MPESTRFREKTAERRARKFNESNLTQPSGDRKLCEISRDFYVRSGHKKRTTSRSRSTNRRRKEERGKSKRKSQTRGGASRQVALETSARSRSRVEETRKKRTSRRKSPMQRKTIEAEINTGRGQRRTPKNQKRMKEASRPQEQARDSKRSKSFNFAKHHGNCRCYICTCRRSNHQCPVSKGLGKPFLGNTINRTDFKVHPEKFYRDAMNPAGRNLNVPKDNLRFVGAFNPKTETRDNYKKHPRDAQNEDYWRDRDFNDFIRNKNNEDHIKKALPSVKMQTKEEHRNFKHGDLGPAYSPMKRYRKSASPIRSSAPFLGRTVYQKDFKEWKGSGRKKPFKHGENLRAYNPEIPMAKFTEYNHANYMHMINKEGQNSGRNNRELFELFKQRDKIPGGVILKNERGRPKRSEYEERYKKWQVPKNDCDLAYMPKVDPDLTRLKDHIYWNKFKDDWTCRQDSYYD